MGDATIGIADQPNNPDEGAPVTMFTIMAMLEMSLNGLGKLENVWVMAALQGGFAFTVQRKDFVFITVTLLFRAIRIFCSSPEHNMQQLVFFYWLFQLVSAITTGVVSAMQLFSQDFGQTEEAYKANRNFALNVFYGIAFAETLLLLAWFYFLRRPFGMVGENVNALPTGVVESKKKENVNA